MTTEKRDKSAKAASTREARLKAALKANMGRRKAQQRARAQDDATASDNTTTEAD